MVMPLVDLANPPALAERRKNNANMARALLGQGLTMGWGDELEAMLSKGDYQTNLDNIRQLYAKYAKENPIESTTAEFIGGAIPGVAAMLIPGLQPAGANQIARSGLSQAAKLAGIGATAGAISGSGSATEGQRAQGAIGGGVLGGVLGVALPPAIKSAGAGYNWLKNKLATSDSAINDVVTQKMAKTLERSGMTPADIETKMLADRVPGMPVVPSTIADTSQPLSRLAEAVVNRAGKGADIIETKLGNRQVDIRPRTKEIIRSRIAPENYMLQGDELAHNMRTNARPYYDAAYAYGEVDDPVINAAIELSPDIQHAFEKAKDYAKRLETNAILKGEDPTPYQLREFITQVQDPKTGNMVFKVTQNPDVRTLDYMKKGLDDIVEKGYLKDTPISNTDARVLKDTRNIIRDRLKSLVPEYDKALTQFAGDAEVYGALKAGREEFLRTPHEEVARNVAAMAPTTKQAYITGAFRAMENMVDNAASNQNFAAKFLTPNMQGKLRPLFNNDAEFNLINAALQRESQMFKESGKIIGNSRTALRQQLSKDLEGDTDMTDAVVAGVSGGPGAGLWKMATNAIRKAGMTEEVADRLAKMLMSDNPHDVANVVKVLQQYNAAQAPKAAAVAATKRGATTGTTSAFWPTQSVKDTPKTQSSDENPSKSGLSEIERDIQADKAGATRSKSGLSEIERDIQADKAGAAGSNTDGLSEIERDILADEAKKKSGK